MRGSNEFKMENEGIENYMKSSLPEADRHDENVTHWDDYHKCEILPKQVRDRLSDHSKTNYKQMK